MAPQTEGKWQNLSSFTDSVSKLLLPLVIAGLGATFGYIQHRADVEQRKADRVTTFITHLSSKNEKEKEIALRVMNVLIEKKQLPSELGPALISGVGDTNKTISELSQGAITKLAVKDSSLERTLAQAVQQDADLAQKVKARVFIHTTSRHSGLLADSIAVYLREKKYTVPDIQKVKVSPAKTQLRYYREEEKDEADEIIKQLLAFSKLDTVEARILKRYASSVRPRTYELWLGAGLIKGED